MQNIKRLTIDCRLHAVVYDLKNPKKPAKYFKNYFKKWSGEYDEGFIIFGALNIPKISSFYQEIVLENPNGRFEEYYEFIGKDGEEIYILKSQFEKIHRRLIINNQNYYEFHRASFEIKDRNKQDEDQVLDVFSLMNNILEPVN